MFRWVTFLAVIVLVALLACVASQTWYRRTQRDAWTDRVQCLQAAPEHEVDYFSDSGDEL